jgi:hypothetical protein
MLFLTKNSSFPKFSTSLSVLVTRCDGKLVVVFLMRRIFIFVQFCILNFPTSLAFRKELKELRQKQRTLAANAKAITPTIFLHNNNSNQSNKR